MTTPAQIEKAKQEIRERAHRIGFRFEESEVLHVQDSGMELVFLRRHKIPKLDEFTAMPVVDPETGEDVLIDEALCYMEFREPTLKFDWSSAIFSPVFEQPKLKILSPALFSKVEGDTQTFYDGEVVEHK